MRERVELLVGRSARGDVGDDLPLGVRAHAARRGRRDSATRASSRSTTRPTRARLDQALHRRARRRPQALHAGARSHSQISDAKNRLRDAAAVPRSLVGSYFEQTVADVYELYERELHARATRWTSTTCSCARSTCSSCSPRSRALPRRFRHVLVDEYQDTNHAQYRMARAARRRARATSRGRRRRPVDLRASAAPTSATSSSSSEDFPDAHVVKLEQNYRSTQTILAAANAVIANNRDASAKDLWTELGDGRPITVRELADEHAEARYVAGEVERARRARASRARRDRRLLPDQRAVARARGRARPRRHPLPGDRRHAASTSARRSRTRSPTCPLLANPADEVSFTRVVNTPRRGIGRRRSRGCSPRCERSASRLGGGADPAGARPRRRAVRAIGRFMGTMVGAARARRAGRAGGRAARGVLDAERLLETLRAERTIEAQGGSRTSRSSSTSPPSTTRAGAEDERIPRRLPPAGVARRRRRQRGRRRAA